MLGDEVLAASLIDRLLHHCHIIFGPRPVKAARRAQFAKSEHGGSRTAALRAGIVRH